MKYLIPFFAIALMWSCSSDEKAISIIESSINAHGFNALDQNKISFDFRSKRYSVENLKGQKIYTRSFIDDSSQRVNDVLINSSKFKRYINGKTVDLEEEWKEKFGNSVNSVLYFFQLPMGLTDPAVNQKYLGEAFIDGKVYDKIQVTFEQEGGGTDYQDVFVYWFNKKSKMLDYLAYSYLTDGGGMRFRQAYNRKKVGGFVFQDYINYEPFNKNASLLDLDTEFISGNLKELSRIQNENITVD